MRKHHHGVAVIEVTDPLLLTEIESDPALQEYLGERMSDRCVAVRPDGVQEVVRRLQSLGHMPTVASGHAARQPEK
jgi:hypothetical protein